MQNKVFIIQYINGHLWEIVVFNGYYLENQWLNNYYLFNYNFIPYKNY